MIKILPWIYWRISVYSYIHFNNIFGMRQICLNMSIFSEPNPSATVFLGVTYLTIIIILLSRRCKLMRWAQVAILCINISEKNFLWINLYSSCRWVLQNAVSPVILIVRNENNPLIKCPSLKWGLATPITLERVHRTFLIYLCPVFLYK